MRLTAEHADEADMAAEEELFRKPFPLGRGLQCRDEKWHPDPRCLRLVRGPESGQVSGFIVTGQPVFGRKPEGGRFVDFEPPKGGDVLNVTDHLHRTSTPLRRMPRGCTCPARP